MKFFDEIPHFVRNDSSLYMEEVVTGGCQTSPTPIKTEIVIPNEVRNLTIINLFKADKQF